MKVGVIPETLGEWLLAAAGAVPTPLVDTFQAMVRARAIMVGTKLGVFEALRQGPATAEAVARQIGTDPRATEKLLNSLVGAGYLHFRRGGYRLARVARQWLLQDSPRSLYDSMLYRFLEWEVVEHFEDYVRTGKPLDVHENLPPDRWDLYQRGMRSVAGLSAPEVARRLPLADSASRLLDLGGAHGYYSVAFCRRHRQLRATVLDLPAAVRCAEPILAREGLGDRIGFRAEDLCTADLGCEEWDVIFASQLLHHFAEETNRQLLGRIARALRPGGLVAIVEVLRPSSPRAAGQTGTLLDLFFATVSPSGSWSAEELAAWQRQAGLMPRRLIRLLSLPGAGIQAAVKPEG
ncbi:MAG: class I SAM-dependent methyltransferase [Planctomycetes bacterium]|nr:class I SAM-dependent methyltransferase [Planctomycetota bacterium]